jgi:hypothetical protein
MTSDGDSASRYSSRNVLWDDLPPKRRRFFIWLFLLLILIGPLATIPLQLFGLSDLWAGVVVLIAVACVLIPLGWAAWQELQERRATGEEPAPAHVRGAVLAAWIVVTLLFWVLVVMVAIPRGPVIPLIPILFTVITVMRFRQWLRQDVRNPERNK